MEHTPGRSAVEMDMPHTQIGVVGDNAQIYGGIHFYTSPTRSLDLLPFKLDKNIRAFLLSYLGTEGQPVPFGGREQALQWLEQWRMRPDKRLLLLAAPAGRGKSALLCRWAERLSQSEPSKQVAVVFVPISSRFNTNLPELIFACIAAQLAVALGEEVPADYLNMPHGFWQSLAGEYLCRPLPDGRQLLLIVDGLDEAAWDIGPSLFPHPQDLPATTRVVVSARYLAGDLPGPAPWLRRLGWEDFRLAEAMSLDTLTREGMRDVLANMGRPLDTLLDREEIIDQLYRLTGGDPLLVELYVKSLSRREESSVQLRPEDLAQIKPDYRGFFGRWWDVQEQLWRKGKVDPLEKEVVIELLAILATALGPLSLGDVKHLMRREFSSSKYRILQALKLLRGFVIGDGEEIGFSFAHPRFGDYFREVFLDVGERQAWQGAFIHWGTEAISRRQTDAEAKERLSPYLLQYFSQHLSLAEAPVESFLCLLSYEWLTDWHRYAGTYTGFLRDIDTVLKRLISIDQQVIAQGRTAPYIGQEIWCVLCHASVCALSSNMPTELLVALLRYGGWTDEQTLAYAQQKLDPESRANALIKLAPYLSHVRQQETYQKALQTVLFLQNEREQSNLLRALAPHLPGPVYQAAMALQNKWYRTHVLSAVAPHLPEAVYLEAMGWSEEEERAKVLLAVAPHLLETKRTEALQQALQAALALSDEWWRASMLSKLAPYLNEPQRAEALQQALQTALTLLHEEAQVSVLNELAPHLPEEVYQAALLLQDKSAQAGTLCAVVPHLPEAERTEALQQALRAVLAISDERGRAWALSKLAPHLPEAIYGAALALRNEWERVDVLAALAPHLPEAVYQVTLASRSEDAQGELLGALAPHLPATIYQTVLAVPSEKARANLLSALAPHLPEAERAEAIRQALEAAQALGDEGPRTNMLGALAPYLLRAERDETLQRALRAALALSEDEKRAKVLLDIAPHLPEADRAGALQQALEATRAIWDERAQAWMLSELAPYLNEPQRAEALQQALQIALTLADEGAQASVLSELAPHLPEAVYQAALALGGEWEQAWVLRAVAPCLPETVYQAALTLQDKTERASILCAVAPHLPEAERAKVLQQGLQAALAEPAEGSRAFMLIKLAPHLPKAVYEAAPGLQNETLRAEVLRVLAPHLPKSVYQAALALGDEWTRATVLAALVPFLVTLAPEALYAGWATVSPPLKERPRSEALTVLAKLVPVIKSLGGDPALSQTLRAVEDVCQWWP